MGAYGKTTEPSADKTTGAQKLWYSRQADEMRARKLIGTTVVNAANETVGDVNEIVLTRDGKVRLLFSVSAAFSAWVRARRCLSIGFVSLERRDLLQERTRGRPSVADSWGNQGFSFGAVTKSECSCIHETR